MLDRKLKEAFARIVVAVEFVTLPSKRYLVEADRGNIDGDNNRVAGLQSGYPQLIQVPESKVGMAYRRLEHEAADLRGIYCNLLIS